MLRQNLHPSFLLQRYVHSTLLTTFEVLKRSGPGAIAPNLAPHTPPEGLPTHARHIHTPIHCILTNTHNKPPVFSSPGDLTSKFSLGVAAGVLYTLAWGVSTWVVTFTRCAPVALAYDRGLQLANARAGGALGTCRDPVLLGVIVAVLSLVGDVLIILLPLPTLVRLRGINRRKKAAVIGIFLLGSW